MTIDPIVQFDCFAVGCPSGHHCRNSICVPDVVTEGCQITGCPTDHFCVRDGEFKGKCVSVMSPPGTVPPASTGSDDGIWTKENVIVIAVSISALLAIVIGVILYKMCVAPKKPVVLHEELAPGAVVETLDD
eukprot:TRINITY_DN2591_c0_g2_i1.p1 TRINITY_DN2591_c0_g2~~TRINITY_DN2591_c0_g2_i1.p1  ORF type:complete len:132 (+),score=15.84 TRINITY_DN2591_c0_g2_i1:106-501(+)